MSPSPTLNRWPRWRGSGRADSLLTRLASCAVAVLVAAVRRASAAAAIA
jgi:hypothetical protein